MRSALRWHTLVPPVSLVVLLLTLGAHPGGLLAVPLGLLLVGSVLAAVHHAEVVAHRAGEPFGSLILALAVTVIEVGVILMSMTGPTPEPTLGRDTVFAAVMICLNGIAGLSLMLNAGRKGEALFRAKGSGSMLAAVLVLATVTLVLPNFTSAPGPRYSTPQLVFAAVASLAGYLLFITTQTQTHRDFFQPVNSAGELVHAHEHADPPTARQTALSAGLLVVSLVGVVGLAKIVMHVVKDGITAVGLPASFVGVLLALIVLAPETLAAVQASRRDRVQISLNLAYGSAIASIALTIPVLAVVSILLRLELHLGLSPLHLALLCITALVSMLTVLPGRAGRLQAGLHLLLLGAYVFLAAAP